MRTGRSRPALTEWHGAAEAFQNIWVLISPLSWSCRALPWLLPARSYASPGFKIVPNSAWDCGVSPHIIAAVGILCLMIGFTSRQPVWLGLGGSLLSFQSSLVWKAARTIDAKPAAFVLTLLGPLLVGLGGATPGVREFAGSLALIMGAAYTQ